MAVNETKSTLACPHCDFIGKSEHSLKVHIGRAHMPQRRRRAGAGMAGGRKGSTCPVCGKVSKTPTALKAHIHRMHRGVSGRAMSAEVVSPVQQQLVPLSLGDLASLHDACLAELKRRLVD
jgi:uncharacterized C2H2 Zn-finger protein